MQECIKNIKTTFQLHDYILQTSLFSGLRNTAKFCNLLRDLLIPTHLDASKLTEMTLQKTKEIYISRYVKYTM